MKAMLWKELRENFRWATLGCLVLALAEFYILGGMQRTSLGNSGNPTLTDPSFLMVIHFGSALVAGGLAALQILSESSRDRWAALLHRPVSRSVIFGGKVIAGLGLYAAAAVPPFLVSAGYAAWPGKFAAPFVPGLLVPGLHALAGGVACYFASLLLCLHRGRWLGTRGVLLLAAGTVFLLQLDMTGPFLLVPLLAAAVLALAAWQAMLGESSVGRGYSLRRIAFAAVILLGAQGGLLLVGFGLSLLPNPKTAAGTYTRLVVTQEGQVLRIRSGPYGENQVVTDLAGNPVTDERYLGNNSYQNTCQFWPLNFAFGSRRRGTFFAAASSLSGTSYVQEVQLGNGANESWFSLVRRNYFIGYDNLSRRCVGICDREGFKAPGAKPVPFTGRLRGTFFYTGPNLSFWNDHQVYAINFFDRQLKPFFAQPDRTIDEAMQLPIERTAENYRYLVLALEDGIEVLDGEGRLVFARPYLHDPRRWESVEVATNQAVDRLYFQSQTGFYHPVDKRVPDVTYLDELDLHGNLLHAYSQPIDNTVAAGPAWLMVMQACLLPIAPAVLQHLYSHFVPFSSSGSALSFERDVLALDFAGWSGMCLLAAALAVVAFVWARRIGFGARGAWGWAAFVLAFGPAGLLTFRLAANWPERVRCPFCGRSRVLSEDTCPHCQHGWETPPPSGTEIFQPLPVQG